MIAPFAYGHAGCTIASSTTACSTATRVRFFSTGLRRSISAGEFATFAVELLEPREAVPAPVRRVAQVVARAGRRAGT